MINDKINYLISETEKYIKDTFQFHNPEAYVEKTHNTGSFFESSVSSTEMKKTTTDKKAVVEMDIFGNVTIRREPWEFAETLDELNSLICNCKKCPLGETRINFVFGVGDTKTDIVVIGEAPGAEEDAQGEPFVGKAGQLLNKILEATGFKRENVYIMNILKCRPPGNRNPLPEEVEKCRPYLEKQLKLINPKLILILGKVAADALLKTREPLHKIRGKILSYKEWKVMVTFHPAALLRNPHWKRPAWEDMQQFRDFYKKLKSQNC